MQVTLQSKFVFSIAMMLHSCLFIFLAHLPCDLAGQVSGLFPYGGRESGTRGRGTVVIVFHNTVGVVSLRQLLLFSAGVGFIAGECSVVGGHDRHIHFIVAVRGFVVVRGIRAFSWLTLLVLPDVVQSLPVHATKLYSYCLDSLAMLCLFEWYSYVRYV
jgi:hypothetical protein